MKLIVVINNKGGVGKTTSVVNLAAWFAKMKQKTLLIDLDPSSSASIHLGFDKTDKAHQTLCDFLLSENSKLSDYIYPAEQKNLSCLPSEPALSDFYEEIKQDSDVEFFLNRKDIPSDFDIVLFDSPPNMGSLALNALAIADYALVPVQTQYLALSGLELTVKLIDKAQRRLNPGLQVLGYFGTHYDRRTNVAKDVLNFIREKYGKNVFRTAIGVNSKLIEAYHAQKPILYYAPSARGSREYGELAKEILNRLNTNTIK